MKKKIFGSVLSTIRARAISTKLYEDLAASTASTAPARAEAITQRKRLNKIDIPEAFTIVTSEVLEDGSRKELKSETVSASDFFINYEPILERLVTGPQNTKQFLTHFRTVSSVTDKVRKLYYKVCIAQ